MKVPRFRIARVMIAVAFAALNFAVIRVVLDHGGPASELLAMGILPMANVLAVGILIGQRHPGSRPFLLGFEAFGTMALALFVTLAVLSPQVMIPYLELSLQFVRNTIGQGPPVVLIATMYSVAVVMLGLPQLASALMGGFLSRKYRITITERPAQLPSEE